MTVEIIHGDCIEQMRNMPDNSVDSIVTDPPYGLGFMGKAWDTLPPGEDWARECLRVLKPGGHLLAFGGTRTWHRLAVAVEDAGFEIRDSIAWMYGSGFPKSHDVSKALDKVNGEGGRLHKFTAWMRTTGLTARQLNEATGTSMGGHYLTPGSQPKMPTPEAWETIRLLIDGPIPAWVDELVGRVEAVREVIGTREVADIRNGHGREYGGAMFGSEKTGKIQHKITTPATTVAMEWQGWGTALKPAFEPVVVARKPLAGTVAANVQEWGTGALNIDASRIGTENTSGRWPANVVLDEHMAAVLDQQSGITKSSGGKTLNHNNIFGWNGEGGHANQGGLGDTGGASRFFYVAKAPKKERPVVDGVAHPTVKPLALMRWLVKLVTPPGGTVLEPFAGSGATVEACILEGFNVIAIEQEADYLPLIQARIDRAA